MEKHFQFFPSCSLARRFRGVVLSIFDFQFFPSCSVEACREAGRLARALGLTFNSFPVAARC
jgi:hypothetical protein